MPNAIDIIRRLADNVYTSPYDKTRDTAMLAVLYASLIMDSEPSARILASAPREMLKFALYALETASASEADNDDTDSGI